MHIRIVILKNTSASSHEIRANTHTNSALYL